MVPDERNRYGIVAAARRQASVDAERLVGSRRNVVDRRVRGAHATGERKGERRDERARGAHTNSPREPANGFEQHGVVGRVLQLRLPEILRQRTLAFRPQHFAQMRGDFRIRPLLHRLPQILLGFVELAEPVLRPADAVEDERIVRRERKRALDQREPLGDPRRAVDERVAERVERVRARRLEARPAA